MRTNPHADNATLIVQRVVEEPGAWYDDNAEALLRAQIQADLAVAYEQRTANLIAMWSKPQVEMEDFRSGNPATYSINFDTVGNLLQEILERLGVDK